MSQQLITVEELVERMAFRSVSALELPQGATVHWSFSDGTFKTDAQKTAMTAARQEAILYLLREVNAGQLILRTWSQIPVRLPVEYPEFLKMGVRDSDAEAELKKVFGDVLSSSAVVDRAHGTEKIWTPERLREMATYRAEHGTKKTAEHYDISEGRVRQLLPGRAKSNGEQKIQVSNVFTTAKRRAR